MTSESKTEVQLVRKSTKFDILVSELIVLPYALVGGIFFVLLVLIRFPTIDIGNIFIFLTLLLFFPVLLGVTALFRNHILEWVFGKLSHDGIFQFAVGWHVFPFFLVVVLLLLLSLNVFREPTSLLFWLTFLSLCMPLFFILEHPLSNEGAVQILFEGLFSSLDNFHRRQYYWKKISKAIEKSLKNGNIQVSSDDLTYHFNKKLLETNEDISDDLRSIQAWMLGRQKSCLDSIKRIFPEVKIEPCTKDSFLRRVFRVLENPTPTRLVSLNSLLR